MPRRLFALVFLPVLALFLLCACQESAPDTPNVSEPGSSSVSGASGSSSSQESPPEQEIPETQDVFFEENPDGTRSFPLPADLTVGETYLVEDPDRPGESVSALYTGQTEDGTLLYEIIREPDLSQEELDLALQDVMTRYDAMAVSVAAIEDGKVTASGAWGWAEADVRPMTADTKMRVASLSKVAIAMCACSLVEDGTLNLSDPLSEYWGDGCRNPYTERQPTIEDVLTHTSSIQDLELVSGLDNLRSALTTAWRNVQPGDPGSWSYSNFGYSVLGTTLEIAADMPLDGLFHERFLDPLGIRASFHSGNLEEEELATLYQPGGIVARSAAEQANGYVPQEIGMGATYFPGGMTISAVDMARLVAVLINRGKADGTRLLEESTVEDMETPRFEVSPGTPAGFGQCLALRVLENLYGRERIYYHSGSAYGVYSLLTYDPDTGDGVVVLTTGAASSRTDRGLYSLCSDLSELLYKEMEGDQQPT